MAGKSLRLRLAVRRHGLPEAKVVFTVALDGDPTISKLIEQVNETIPLESEDWGLEDYVVELRTPDGGAFECLHFQPVASVLEKDEEVIIRPLFSHDIKKRRLSGRYQISNDGRHLIDGVPFGRPLLKRPSNRPPVHISPRKRRRVAYDDEDDDAGEHDQPLLLTQAGENDAGPSSPNTESPLGVRIAADFDDADDDDDEMDNEDDDDFVPADADRDGDDDGDVAAAASLDDDELQSLLDDMARHGESQSNPKPETGVLSSPKPAPLLDLQTLDKIAALRQAFPDASFAEVEKTLLKNRKDERRAYRRLVKRHHFTLTLDDMLLFRDALQRVTPPPRGQKRQAESDTDSTDSAVRRFDTHGFPPGSLSDGTALEHMARARRRLPRHSGASRDRGSSVRWAPGTISDVSGLADEIDETSDEGSVSVPMPRRVFGSVSRPFPEEESSSDSSFDSSLTSSSDSSGDENDEDDDSDSGPEFASAKKPRAPGHHVDDTTSSSGTSSSGSDSDSDSDSHGGKGGNSRGKHKGELAAIRDEKDSDSEDTSSDSDGTSSEGSSSSSSKEALDEDSSSEDDDSSGNSGSAGDGGNGSSSSDSDSDSSDSDSSSDDSDSQFGDRNVTGKPSPSAKASNGGDTGSGSAATAKPSPSALPPFPAEKKSSVVPGEGKASTKQRNARRRAAMRARKAALAGSFNVSSQAGSATAELGGAGDELSAKKQALLDMLSTPSHDETSKGGKVSLPGGDTDQAAGDEEASESQASRRAKLDLGAGRRMLFGALGLRNPKTKADEDKIRAALMKDVRPHVNHRVLSGSDAYKQPVEDDNPEAWRDKITYRAVECCHEGVVLSEPPFPFVQRWDPQQQVARNHQGNDRGGKGKRKERNHAHFYEDDDPSASKRRRVDSDENLILNYDDNDDGGGGSGGSARKIAIDESQFTDLDDLPSLPKDLSSLSVLQPSQAQIGMVITWKQWLLSKKTNWQPQVVDLTAVVINVDDDGASLRVLLARRDRDLDRKEKNYDEVTGQRVYDRFEAPDDDGEVEDDEDAFDEGYRTVTFSDLIEPRIVQQPLQMGPESDASHRPSSGIAPTTPQQGQVEDHSSRAHSVDNNSASNGEKSTTLEHESDKSQEGHNRGRGDGASESLVPETNYGVSNAASTQLLQVASNQDVVAIGDRPAEDSHREGESSPPVVGRTDSDLESPSQQLEEASKAVAAQTSHRLSREASQVMESPCSRTGVSPDAHTSTVVPTIDSPPKINAAPSSARSTRSGRQPDPDFNVGVSADSFTRFEETADDDHRSDSTPRPPKEQVTPTRPRGETSPRIMSSAKSTSSFPSLSELWHTAPTSFSTQSPSKPSVLPGSQAHKALSKEQLEYDEAMRMLDELDEAEDKASDHNSTYIKTSPQSPVFAGIKSIEEPVSPPALPTIKRRRGSPPAAKSSIPPGTQVISLLTSSPEPEYVERYAEDSIDEDYDEAKGLPTGAGWVQKRLPKSGKARRGLRGQSLPVSRRARSPQGKRRPVSRGGRMSLRI